jgi:16S rRNA (guanine527-N7)-methyltransferase
MTFREKLASRAEIAQLDIKNSLFEPLETYFRLLQQWNRRVSLTSLPVETLGDDAIDRLLIEPLIATRYLPNADVVMMDIGSGGGSPAIPMKIAVPTISLSMVESRGKKAAFLREAVRTLGLIRTTVETARAEELEAEPNVRGTADVISLRAVRADAEMLGALLALLKSTGVLFQFTNFRDEATLTFPELNIAGRYPLLQPARSQLVAYKRAAGVPRGTTARK